jgi:hypothetical protein
MNAGGFIEPGDVAACTVTILNTTKQRTTI